MNRTIKFRLIGFIPLFVCLMVLAAPSYAQPFVPVQPADAGLDANRLNRLTQTLTEYTEQQRLSGAVVLILHDGNAVVHQSFGKLDVEKNIPMPENALFRIASQTKAIVSTAVMILQEEGRLLISDPVGKYLPEYAKTTVAVPDNNGGYVIEDARRAITIRDLLMHTAGIGYGYGVAADQWKEAELQGWYFAHRNEPIRETVRRMASLPMDAHPGERFVYGYNTDILGALVEVVSGMPLDEFLQTRLFDPLAMTDTHFYLPESKAVRLATVYSATETKGIVKAPDPGLGAGQGHYVTGPRTSFSGGAGLVSTARDYAVFLQMLLNGGEYNGARILSPKTVQLMTINHLNGIDFRPGLGISLAFDVVMDVGIRGVPGSVGDFGWGGAYHTTYWVSPEDRLVVVFMTQLIPATGSDIHAKLRTLLYQAMVP